MLDAVEEDLAPVIADSEIARVRAEVHARHVVQRRIRSRPIREDRQGGQVHLKGEKRSID